MEVLKTSDELEKQILEDARKKASRILESTEKECAQIRLEWEKKLQDDARRMEEDNTRRIAALKQELAATLPLDRMRERLSYIEKTLIGKLKECFEGLTAIETAEVFSVLIRRVASIFSGKRITAYVGGIADSEAIKMLTACIPSAVVIGIRPLAEAAAMGTGEVILPVARGLVLESEDKRILYRGTFNELARLLLEEHRDALVESLIGKDV